MSKRIFSLEQISELLKNKNVIRCSDKSITYHHDFKIQAVMRYQDEGIPARQIFKEAGFNIGIIGRDAPVDHLKRWRKIVKIKGIKNLSKEQRGATKGGSNGRHSLKDLTDHEKIKYLEAKVAYLKAENSFLAKLRAKQKR